MKTIFKVTFALLLIAVLSMMSCGKKLHGLNHLATFMLSMNT